MQRNRKIFGQQCTNSNIMQLVEMQTKEFLYCVADLRKGKTETSRLVKWLKPHDGWWKLNTDGFFLASSRLVSGGGII